MPTITLNATNAQAARLDEARVSYNTANETSLTMKQFIYVVLKDAVRRQLSPTDALVTTALAQAAATNAQIESDMQGGT